MRLSYTTTSCLHLSLGCPRKELPYSGSSWDVFSLPVPWRVTYLVTYLVRQKMACCPVKGSTQLISANLGGFFFFFTDDLFIITKEPKGYNQTGPRAMAPEHWFPILDLLGELEQDNNPLWVSHCPTEYRYQHSLDTSESLGTKICYIRSSDCVKSHLLKSN